MIVVVFLRGRLLFLSVSECNLEEFQTAVWKRKKERERER